MKQRLILILCTVVGFSSSALVFGLEWRELRYSPIYYFTDEDHQMMKEAGRNALENESDGTVVSWENPATNNAGTITPLQTYEDNGTLCRKVKIFNQAGDQTATSYFNFCKQEDGTWKVAPKPQ